MDIQQRENAIRKYIKCKSALVTTTEAAQILTEIGVPRSESRLRTARAEGPPHLKIGGSVRYRVKDILEFAGIE